MSGYPVPYRKLKRLKQRRRRLKLCKPDLSIEQILGWADAWKQRFGEWPTAKSGPVLGAAVETWMVVEKALTDGRRGLPGGSSLAQFLAKHRGHRNCSRLPRFSVEQILAWADCHHHRTGEWPTRKSGRISGTDEKWMAVDVALHQGRRGLAGGSSLYQLLEQERGRRRRTRPPHLTVKQVLAWADGHKQRTGRWPSQESGVIAGIPGETWKAVDLALNRGGRGLPRASLAQLLAEHRGARNLKNLPNLAVETILQWAKQHRRRTGVWPVIKSGGIMDAPGETWAGVNFALRTGRRGLRGGGSLAQLLAGR